MSGEMSGRAEASTDVPTLEVTPALSGKYQSSGIDGARGIEPGKDPRWNARAAPLASAHAQGLELTIDRETLAVRDRHLAQGGIRAGVTGDRGPSD